LKIPIVGIWRLLRPHLIEITHNSPLTSKSVLLFFYDGLTSVSRSYPAWVGGISWALKGMRAQVSVQDLWFEIHAKNIRFRGSTLKVVSHDFGFQNKP